MQAIVTKVLPATYSLGTRIKATAAAGSITLGYHSIDCDGAFSGEEQRHRAAAMALREKFEWDGDIVTGQLPNGDYCHVFVESKGA